MKHSSACPANNETKLFDIFGGSPTGFGSPIRDTTSSPWSTAQPRRQRTSSLSTLSLPGSYTKPTCGSLFRLTSSPDARSLSEYPYTSLRKHLVAHRTRSGHTNRRSIAGGRLAMRFEPNTTLMGRELNNPTRCCRHPTVSARPHQPSRFRPPRVGAPLGVNSSASNRLGHSETTVRARSPSRARLTRGM